MPALLFYLRKIKKTPRNRGVFCFVDRKKYLFLQKIRFFLKINSIFLSHFI